MKRYPIFLDPKSQIIESAPGAEIEIESPEWWYKIGGYIFWPLKNEGYWIENQAGEGMKITDKISTKIREYDGLELDKWWAENF